MGFTWWLHNYDLILTDFHLNETVQNKGIDGDTIVETVRKKNIFTEILFYTAKAPLQGKLTWDRISFLETAELPDVHHEEVVKKTKKLIDLTIEKFHDIVVMRGMIMNETSDLDAQQLAILSKYIEGKTATETNQLKCDILQKIDEHFNQKLTYVNGDWKTKDSGFKKLMKDNFVFSSDYKIQTLGWILNELSEEDFSINYKDEIITIRNKFAHAILEEEKDIDGNITRKYFKYKDDGMTFDANLCKNIRKNIKKHKENLEKLAAKVSE